MVTARPSVKVASLSQAGIVSLVDQDLGDGVKTVDGLVARSAVTGASGAFSGNVTSAEPMLGTHLTTKNYVDTLANALVFSLDPKNSVRVATTASITLSGLQTIDGISLTAGQRVLVKDQVAPAENGIYVAAAGAWARSSDADSIAELNAGTFTYVEAGPTNRGTGFAVTSEPAVLGTDAIDWTAVAGAAAVLAGSGLSKVANTLALVAASTSAFGGVTTSAQSFLGLKTFTSGLAGTTGAFSGAVTSSVASGSTAFSLVQGARLVTNGAAATRYISDDGTNITCTGPVSLSSSLAVTGAITGVTSLTASTAVNCNSYRNQSGQAVLTGTSSTQTSLSSRAADGASAVAFILNSINNLTTSGAKHTSFQNGNGTEVAYVNKDGALNVSGVASGSPAIVMPLGSRIYLDGVGTRYVSDTNDGFTTFVGSLKTTSNFSCVQLNASGALTFGGRCAFSIRTPITASSSGTQASAAALDREINHVATAASPNSSTYLPSLTAGNRVVVINRAANSIDIYVSNTSGTGRTIDSLGADVPYALAAGKTAVFWGISSTLWLANLYA